jgi:hypothetical protein
MAVKPAIWFPIAVIVSVLNVIAVGFAAGPAAVHAMIHAGLALGFGGWALRLRQRARESGQPRLEALEALEIEVSNLRHELSEAQERLDFTERMLAQGQELRRVDPER